MAKKIIANQYLIDSEQETILQRGIEVACFDILNTTKTGTPRKCFIKLVNGKYEEQQHVASNLSTYTRMELIDLASTTLMASVEETKLFIANPFAIIERVLSSGARFTSEDLQDLPKEAHSLIYKTDKNGTRIYNVINVLTNDNYKKYGIKSQKERGVARVLIAYVVNAEEMQKLSIEDRQKHYKQYDIKLVEYNDYLALQEKLLKSGYQK